MEKPPLKIFYALTFFHKITYFEISMSADTAKNCWPSFVFRCENYVIAILFKFFNFGVGSKKNLKHRALTAICYTSNFRD